MRIGDQFFFGRATEAKQSKMAFLFLVAALFYINLAIQPASASMSDIKPRAPGVQCRLSEARLHCDNYSLLEAPTLNPFLAAERLDQICPVASKVLDCVDTLTPGCEVDDGLAHFEVQTALLTLICGSGRRDFLRASKCYSLQEVKDGIEKCSDTLLREMEEEPPCGLTRAIADCAHVEMRKYIECSFTDAELMGQMLEIYYKPTGDEWCRISKENACTKRICKNGGVCRGDYVTVENPCDCSFTGWTGLRCDEHPLGYYFRSQGLPDSYGLLVYSCPPMRRINLLPDEIAFGVMTKDEDAVLVKVVALEDEYIEFKMVDGYITAAYHSNVSGGIHEVKVGSVYVSDGLYHTVRYDLNPLGLVLKVDNEVVTHHPPWTIRMLDELNQVVVGGDLEFGKFKAGTDFEGIIGGLNVNKRLIFYSAADNTNTTLYGDVRKAPTPFELRTMSQATERSKVKAGEDDLQSSTPEQQATTEATAVSDRREPKWSCSDITQCQPDVALLHDAESRQDYVSLCKMVHRSSHCMEESLEDCRRTGAIPEEQIKVMEEQLTAGIMQMKQHCPDLALPSSEPPLVTTSDDIAEPVWSCSDIMKCQPDIKRLQDAQSQQDYGSLCKMVHRSSHCMEGSLEDCRRTGAIPEQQIKIMEQHLKAGIMQMKQHCPDAESSITESPSVTEPKGLTTSSPRHRTCQEIDQCQNLEQVMAAQASQDSEALCKLLNDSLQCVDEALADCRQTGMLSEEQIDVIESAINTKKLNKMCPDLGLGLTATTPEVPTETGQVSTTTATVKHIEEEESFSLIPGMNASSLVNPFLAWLKSGSKLNKAQEKLAIEQKLVAKLMRKKLKLDISLLKKKLKPKNN